MIKKILFALTVTCTLFIARTSVFAQCGTDIIMQDYQQNHPNFQQDLQSYELDLQCLRTNPNVLANLMRRVRVVVHVVSPVGTSIGTFSNISDNQVQSMIDVLNSGFRRTNGGNGVDCEIEFCLADVDPNGNPTSGITREQYQGPQFSVPENTASIQMKAASTWDYTRYLNI